MATSASGAQLCVRLIKFSNTNNYTYNWLQIPIPISVSTDKETHRNVFPWFWWALNSCFLLENKGHIFLYKDLVARLESATSVWRKLVIMFFKANIVKAVRNKKNVWIKIEWFKSIL